MDLDKKDRLILHNQYLILEKLYPESAKEYATCREAIESGFELHYDWMTEFLLPPVTREMCRFVLSVLSMHSCMLRTMQDEEADIELREQAKFHGFDGNAETEYMSYAQFLILELGRFSDLKDAGPHFPNFNSHMPTLHRYRNMVVEWERTEDNKWDLSLADVERIVQAGRGE